MIAALTAVPLLEAQSFTGAIIGTVKDQSDAAVPNARLTAVEVSSNVATKTVSDVRGLFSFPALRSGTYRIDVEAAGFRTLSQPNIEVRVNDRIEIDLKMILGAVNESIVVSAAPALVESQTGAIGNVIENAKVINLPLNQRNPFQLALLSPGVVPAPGFNNLFNGASLFMVRFGSSSGRRCSTLRTHRTSPRRGRVLAAPRLAWSTPRPIRPGRSSLG